MHFTRDSILWTLGLIGAAVTYLLAAERPPTEWSYRDWLQAVSLAIAGIAGTLRTSPLAGENDPLTYEARRRGERIIVALLAVGLGFSSACGGRAKARHVAVQGSVGLHAAIAAIDDTEAALFSSGAITPVEHQKLNPQIVLLLKAGRSANAAVKAWPAGAPIPGELLAAVMQLGVVADSIAAGLQDGQAKTRLQERIAIAKAAVTALLALSPLITGGTDGSAEGTALHGTGRQGYLDRDRDTLAAPRLALAGG